MCRIAKLKKEEHFFSFLPSSYILLIFFQIAKWSTKNAEWFPRVGWISDEWLLCPIFVSFKNEWIFSLESHSTNFNHRFPILKIEINIIVSSNLCIKTVQNIEISIFWENNVWCLCSMYIVHCTDSISLNGI